jgi:hypothetical protein
MFLFYVCLNLHIFDMFTSSSNICLSTSDRLVGGGGTEAVVKQKRVGSSQAMEDCRRHSLMKLRLRAAEISA